MRRRLQLVGHLSTEELEKRYKASKEVIERGHYQLIWLLSRGKSVKEAAEVTGYSMAWAYELVRSYNAQGPAALGDGRHHNQGNGQVQHSGQFSVANSGMRVSGLFYSSSANEKSIVSALAQKSVRTIASDYRR